MSWSLNCCGENLSQPKIFEILSRGRHCLAVFQGWTRLNNLWNIPKFLVTPFWWDKQYRNKTHYIFVLLSEIILLHSKVTAYIYQPNLRQTQGFWHFGNDWHFAEDASSLHQTWANIRFLNYLELTDTNIYRCSVVAYALFCKTKSIMAWLDYGIIWNSDPIRLQSGSVVTHQDFCSVVCGIILFWQRPIIFLFR